MRLRNGEHGYGVVTKFLHWLTVAAIAGSSPSAGPWRPTIRR
jgi:cytochrome b561